MDIWVSNRDALLKKSCSFGLIRWCMKSMCSSLPLSCTQKAVSRRQGMCLGQKVQQAVWGRRRGQGAAQFQIGTRRRWEADTFRTLDRSQVCSATPWKCCTFYTFEERRAIKVETVQVSPSHQFNFTTTL